MAETVESFAERCARIGKEWVVLARRARAWCAGNGHQMGPLHQHSVYDRIDHTRTMTCRRCHFHLWVKLSGETMGVPAYQECPVARQQREYQERMQAQKETA
jgi:hypothetical protein